MEYVKELLESVKENFYVPEAVDDMAECCAIFAKEFGETDIKCAEPYFYYGKALLEMSRLEAEVLGHAMEGIDIYAEDSSDPQVSWLMSLIFIVNTLYRLRVLMLCPIPRRLLSRRMSRRL